MGSGATATDIANIGIPNNGCGFECHSPDATTGGYPGYTNGFVSGVTTRFNALPTTDQGTQIADAVNWLTQDVVTTNSGNGTTNSPYKFAFLVTDGAEDHAFGYVPGSYDTLASPQGTWNGTAYGSVMQWSPVCANLKNKGVTLAVIYTTYDNVGGVQYADMVAPFVGNIAMRRCSSFSRPHSSKRRIFPNEKPAWTVTMPGSMCVCTSALDRLRFSPHDDRRPGEPLRRNRLPGFRCGLIAVRVPTPRTDCPIAHRSGVAGI